MRLKARKRRSAFVDSYRMRLEEAVRAKIEGQEVAVAVEKEPAAVRDLMEALKASVEATKARKAKPSDAAKTA